MSHRLFRSSIRVCIWMLGVLMSMLPIAFASHTDLKFNVFDLAYDINRSGIFRDFFFLIVVIITTTCANVVDAVVMRSQNFSRPIRIGSVIFIFYSIYTIAYACMHFAELVDHSVPLQPAQLNADVQFMTTAMVAALLAEIVLGLAE